MNRKADDQAIAWILGRARAFDETPGLREPIFPCREIARNLYHARGVKLTRQTVWQIIKKHDPELAKRRGSLTVRRGRPRRKRNTPPPPIPSAEKVRQALQRGLEHWNARLTKPPA